MQVVLPAFFVLCEKCEKIPCPAYKDRGFFYRLYSLLNIANILCSAYSSGAETGGLRR